MSFKQPPLPDGLVQFEDYAIRVKHEHSHSVEFEAVKIVAWSETQVFFEREGSLNSMDNVTAFDEAETFLSGNIKWDGCSNWDFHTEECQAHFCGRKSATSVGRLIDRLYDLAKEKMGATMDDELAA